MASQGQIEYKVQRENWLEDHPKLKEIQSYGYYNENPALAKAVMMVYLDLCESKHWFAVSTHPCASLRLVYITGKRTKKSKAVPVIPVTIDTLLTMGEIQNIIKEVNTSVKEKSEPAEDCECWTPSVTMAFCEADSTVVYYDFFRGLVPPDPPTEEAEVKPKRKRTRHKNN